MLFFLLTVVCSRTKLWRGHLSLVNKTRDCTAWERRVNLWKASPVSLSFSKQLHRVWQCVFLIQNCGTSDLDIYLLSSFNMLVFPIVIRQDMAFVKSVLWQNCIETHFLWVIQSVLSVLSLYMLTSGALIPTRHTMVFNIFGQLWMIIPGQHGSI